MRTTYLNKKRRATRLRAGWSDSRATISVLEPFREKNVLEQKDAHRDSEPNAPILMPRCLFWSRFVRKVYFFYQGGCRVLSIGLPTENKKYFFGGLLLWADEAVVPSTSNSRQEFLV